MAEAVKLPAEFLARIRETPITDALGGRLPLKKRGGRLVGLCPFHNEKTPSFGVQTEANRFFCFGCHKAGDVIDIVQHFDGLDFREAVEHLAGLAGLEMPTEALTEAQQRAETERKVALRCIDAATEWWSGELYRSINAGHRELRRRGIDRKAGEAWRLGWAPVSWDGLTSHLQRLGFSGGDGVRAGVLVEKDGRVYDRFRGRLMFPISDRRGRVIGAGGRQLEDDGTTAKYINTPATALYDKGRALYGLDRAVSGLRSLKRVVVVEGYFDVITPAEAELPGHVSPCGTSITAGHFGELRRLDLPVVLLLDGDAAGMKAARKALRVALAAGVYPLLATLPDGKDPDDIVRDDGAGALAAVLSDARPLLDIVIGEYAARREEPGALGEASALLASVEPVRRARLAGELARVFQVDGRVVRGAISGKEGPSGAVSGPARPPEASSGAQAGDGLERDLLRLLLHQSPEQWRAGIEACAGMLSPDGSAAAAALARAQDGAGMSALDEPGVPSLAREVLALVQADPIPAEMVPRQLRSILALLRLRSLEPLPPADGLSDLELLRLAKRQAERGHEEVALRRMV